MAQTEAAAFCSLNQFYPQPSTRCSSTEKEQSFPSNSKIHTTIALANC